MHFLCKNLKNSTLYAYRQEFFEHNKTFGKFDLIKKFTQEKQQNYAKMPARISNSIIFQVAQEFSSFWGAIKSWHKDKSKFKAKPNIPSYLHKEKGRANVIFTKTAIHTKYLKQGILSLSAFDKTRPIRIELGKLADKIDLDTIQEVRLVKVPNGYEVKIACKVKVEEVETFKPNKVLGIDFGINNLMTVANNLGQQSLIIKGKALKSFNQYFNKQYAKLTSQLDLAKNAKNIELEKGLQRKIERLLRKRKHKINNYLHKSSRYLVNHAVENQIDTLVIGYNSGWKQEANLGKVNNQKFIQIPYLKLLEMIKYKAQLAGLQVIVTEESYTSKCSFLDVEPLQKQKNYLGKRVKRGLFKASNGQLINADVNGALNIIRKVIGEFNYNPIQVCSTPKMINVLKRCE